ncbi:MAG: hypothetical protein PHD54_10850 [Desulfuromonadaceae bacterium]|nr:hypothetical protein [Desulfuromonadaceae bacterium]
MLVKISTIEFEVKNTLPGVKNMVTRIDETMQELKAEFSHLIVDGVAVSDASLDYVKQNRKDIRLVEVIFVTEDQKLLKNKAVKTASRTKPGTIKVTISNIVFEAKNSLPGLKKMFGQINEYMNDFQVYFSHLRVNGNDVTDAPFDYLVNNRQDIHEVEVVFLTAEQYMEQVLSITQTFLDNAVPTIKTIANQFYQKPDDETWKGFNVAMEGIRNIVELINQLIRDPLFSRRVDGIASLGNNLQKSLESMAGALQSGDNTLIADLLHYEIVPFMEDMHKTLNKLSLESKNVVS